MLYGIAMFPANYAIRPDHLARAAEERGFESIFFPEHTHIPASRRSPWPGGADLPKEYWHTYDLFVALAVAAATTKTIKLGTGICLLIERDPITTAKEVASLDQLSNGRVLFGIGGGWNAEEMGNHGTVFKTRWKLLRERVLAMQAIWTRNEAEFHGEMVNFDPIWSFPKPAQKPHPPILLGANAPAARQRVVEYCNGWMPILGRAGDLAAGMRDIAARARAAGKNPSDFSVSVLGVPPDGDAVKPLADLGVDRVIFWVPPEGHEHVLPILDQYAGLVRKRL